MIRRISIVFLEFLAGLTAGAMILALVAWWWLSSGPITLTFLNPYIEEALSPRDSAVAVEIDDTVLVWVGWERAVDVRVSNLRVLDLDRRVVAVMPQVSLGFSMRALFRGLLAPTYLEIIQPQVAVVRNKDGQIAARLADTGTASGVPDNDVVLSGLVKELLAKPDPTRTWGYLRRVGIVDADLTVTDHMLGRVWHAPQADVTMARNTVGITADLVLELKQDGQDGRIAGLAEFRTDSESVDATLDFSDLEVAPFLTLIDSVPLRRIAGTQRQANGTLSLKANVDGDIRSARFDLTSASGHFSGAIDIYEEGAGLGLQVAFENVRSDMFAEAFPTINEWGEADLSLAGTLILSARFDGYVESAQFDLTGSEGRMRVPELFPDPLVIQGFTLRGDMEDDWDQVNITDAAIDLPQGHIVMDAAATRVGGDWSLRYGARANDVPTDDVRKYWPPGAAKNARNWVLLNLRKGTVKDASVSLVARISDVAEPEVTVESLHGGLSVEGLEVNYFHPLPRVTDGRADMTFTADRFDIAVHGASLRDLSVDTGTVVISDMSGFNPKIAIDLTVRGPLQTALTILDSKPLGFLGDLGLDGTAISGNTAARLVFEFPLLKALKVEQVAVAASATLQDVSIDKGPMDLEMQGGSLELKVTGEGLSAEGVAQLNGVPVVVEWGESFNKTDSYKRKVNVSGEIGNLGRQALNLPDLPFLDGRVKAEVAFTMSFDGRREIELHSDLMGASLEFPYLHWRKPPVAPGSLSAFVVVNPDGGAVIEELKVAAGDMLANARAELAPGDMRLKVLEFRELQFSGNRMMGRIGFRDDGGYDVILSGPFINIEKFLQAQDEVDLRMAIDAVPVRIEAHFEEVLLGEGQVLRDVRAVLDAEGADWRSVDVDASVNDARLSVQYVPSDRGRSLRISTDNAGDTLRALGWTERVTGGNLLIAGTQPSPGAPMTGTFSLQEFKVSDAPALARLLQVLSLTGIFTALNQTGLDFVRLDGEFDYFGGVVNVANTRAFGSSIGITTEGVIVTDANLVRLKGTVVPAYTINQVLGKIPILGQLLTGGKNEGLFAANYALNGSLENPQVSVNPLSALAPGFLRTLLGGNVAPLDASTVPQPSD